VAKPKAPKIDDPESFLALANAVAKEKFGPERVADAYHPVLNMAVDAQDPDLTTLQRSNLNDKVAQFLFPKKKAVEVKGDGYAVPTIQIINYGEPKSVAVEQREAIPHGEGQRSALPAPGGTDPDA
jgi:hypothetical protein